MTTQHKEDAMTPAFQHDHIDAMREDEQDKRQSEREAKTCRCPVRPYYTPGSWGSGSTHETRLLDDWQRQHGSHVYARARDELAGAVQAAEGATGSGEAALDMVHDIFSLPRRSERNADIDLVRQMLAAVYEPHEYEEVMRRLDGEV